MATVEEKEKKAVPGTAMLVALLDEIAGRLSSLQRYEEERRAEGVVEPIEPISVTDEVRRVIPPLKPWFSAVIVNDGPDDVWVIVNAEKSFEWHRVAKDETYPVDMKRGAIEDVLLKCDPGKTASVRVVGAR
jgi:hypothetical protein